MKREQEKALCRCRSRAAICEGFSTPDESPNTFEQSTEIAMCLINELRATATLSMWRPVSAEHTTWLRSDQDYRWLSACRAKPRWRTKRFTQHTRSAGSFT